MLPILKEAADAIGQVFEGFPPDQAAHRGQRLSLIHIFLEAARPEKALPLFEELVDQLRKAGIADVQTGRFGADMQVSLVNDGPVTVTLDTDVWG